MSKARKPKLCYHKRLKQWYVRINGKITYLGTDEAEAADLYDDLIADWLRGREDQHRLTVDDLVLLYLKHAERYYSKDGQPTSEVHSIRVALRPLVERHGRTRLRNFGPKALKACRDKMIEAGWARTTINSSVGRIRRMFKWAVAEELIPVEVYQALCTVPGLRHGRTEAPEPEPVHPVSQDHVNAVLPYLNRQVRDMVRLQLLVGCRPTEVCIIRPCDVETDGDVWLYRPVSHKTQYRGRDRVIFIGPRGQEVLRPWLDRAPEVYCFSPAEAEAERLEQRHAQRKTPLSCGNTRGTNRCENPRRKPKDCYTKDSYRRAIQRAIEKANAERRENGEPEIPAWSPNQLRHSRATVVRKTYGLEEAQIMLGHRNADVTQIYAERDLERGKQIALEIG